MVIGAECCKKGRTDKVSLSILNLIVQYWVNKNEAVVAYLPLNLFTHIWRRKNELFIDDNNQHRKGYLRRLRMLLASAPWSLLSSRPTSRAHHRSPRQGDPTGRKKLTDHTPRIHCHCLTRSPTHPASIHSFTQYPSTPRGFIYLPRIQSRRRKRVTYNVLQPTTNQSCTNIINQQLTCGPGHFAFLDRYKKSAWCTWYTHSSPVSHPTAAHQAASLVSAPLHVLQPTHNQRQLDIIKQ